MTSLFVLTRARTRAKRLLEQWVPKGKKGENARSGGRPERACCKRKNSKANLEGRSGERKKKKAWGGNKAKNLLFILSSDGKNRSSDGTGER